MQQKPRPSGAKPIDSLVERGSSSRNDGKVTVNVTAEDNVNGRMRMAHSKSAERRAVCGRSIRRASCHPRLTARERNTYTSTNTARDTPMQRAANISVSPFCPDHFSGGHAGSHCEARDVFDPEAAGDRPADRRRVR